MRHELGVILRGCGFLAALTVLAVGCVSQQKYDELKFAERNCNAERERLAGDLANTQAQNKTFQDRIGELDSSLQGKADQITTLKGQNDDLHSQLTKLTDLYEGFLKRPMPAPIILPAALDAALKDFAARYPNLAQYDSKRGVLKFGSDVVFDLGSDVVKAEAAESLGELAKIITSPAAEEFDTVIVGHTDNVRIGKPETLAKHPTNWHLSVHRAISVMNVLRAGGIASERVGVMGYGEYRPIAPNTVRGNEANRRVELFLVPRQRVGEPRKAPAPKAAKPEK